MSVPGEWLNRARCTQTDPDLFFPEKGSPAPAAKQICRQCAVQRECLAYAITQPEVLEGIWGGMSAAERREPRRLLRLAS